MQICEICGFFRGLTYESNFSVKPTVTLHHHEGGIVMAESTFERVRAIIVDQLDVDPEVVSLESSFKDDLDADSLDLVELIMAFEEEFGGEISDETAQEMQTVGDVVRFLEAQEA